MADDPKTDATPSPSSTADSPWQPPDWLTGDPAEWKSRSWEEWVARDSPFAPKAPVGEPDPEPAVPPSEPPSAVVPPAPPPAAPVEPPEPSEPPPAPSAVSVSIPSDDSARQVWEEIGLEVEALLGVGQTVSLGLRDTDDWIGETPPSADELDRVLARASPARAPLGELVTGDGTVWLVVLAVGLVVSAALTGLEFRPAWVPALLVACLAGLVRGWVVWNHRAAALGTRYRQAILKLADPESAARARARAWESLELRLHDWLTVERVESLTPLDEDGRAVDGPTVVELEEALRSQSRGLDLGGLFDFQLARRLGSTETPRGHSLSGAGLVIFVVCLYWGGPALAILAALLAVGVVWFDRTRRLDRVLEEYRAAIGIEASRPPTPE